MTDHNVSTDPKKIEAVCTWPSPQTAMDVKRFLGLCSYYRCFAPGFADIVRPLYRLTEGQRQFQWTSECEDTFRQLKTLLTLAQYSLKFKGGMRRRLHSTTSHWARVRETIARLVRNFSSCCGNKDLHLYSTNTTCVEGSSSSALTMVLLDGS